MISTLAPQATKEHRCHCGYITYEAKIGPDKVDICHCADCQTLSGSAFQVHAPVEGVSLVIRTGEPTIYVRTADSGNKRKQMFCPKCGTSICSSAIDGGPPFYVRVSTARQWNELTPSSQSWVYSACRWLSTIGSLPKNLKEVL